MLGEASKFNELSLKLTGSFQILGIVQLIFWWSEVQWKYDDFTGIKMTILKVQGEHIQKD